MELQNRSKRGSKGYAVALGNRGSKWYSRSMAILGLLILLFLIVHLGHFWIPNRSNQGWLLGEEINLFEKMKEVFSNPVWVILYTVGVIALFYHLSHGFQSAFRTLGLTNHKYINIIQTVGLVYNVVICLAFIMMPISFYFGWVQ